MKIQLVVMIVLVTVMPTMASTGMQTSPLNPGAYTLEPTWHLFPPTVPIVARVVSSSEPYIYYYTDPVTRLDWVANQRGYVSQDGLQMFRFSAPNPPMPGFYYRYIKSIGGGWICIEYGTYT